MSAANVTPLRPDHEQRYRRWEPERVEAAKARTPEPAVQAPPPEPE